MAMTTSERVALLRQEIEALQARVKQCARDKSTLERLLVAKRGSLAELERQEASRR